MAIHAIDLNRVPRLPVKLAVAMAVLFKMAIDAVHALFKMNVLEMDSLVKFLRIIERDRLVFAVQQRTLAIVLEGRAENPAVAVEVGKLCVLEFVVELGRPGFLQKIHVGP